MSGRAGEEPRLGGSHGGKNLFNKFTTPLPSSFRCAFSDMRRLLEPCWWILFLKITSSVLHYVVCFPGECRPPRDAALAGARGGYGVIPGARSSGTRPRDPGESGGGSGAHEGERDTLHWRWQH